MVGKVVVNLVVTIYDGKMISICKGRCVPNWPVVSLKEAYRTYARIIDSQLPNCSVYCACPRYSKSSVDSLDKTVAGVISARASAMNCLISRIMISQGCDLATLVNFNLDWVGDAERRINLDVPFSQRSVNRPTGCISSRACGIGSQIGSGACLEAAQQKADASWRRTRLSERGSKNHYKMSP